MSSTKAAALIRGRFTSAEFVRTIHVASPEAGIAFDALLEPSYWAHVAHEMKAWDRIEVRPDDASYFAELIVLDVGRAAARVKPLRHVVLDSADTGKLDDGEFEIKWRGPNAKFGVIRVRDKALVSPEGGLSSREEAERWLADYTKALAA